MRPMIHLLFGKTTTSTTSPSSSYYYYSPTSNNNTTSVHPYNFRFLICHVLFSGPYGHLLAHHFTRPLSQVSSNASV